MVFEVVCEALYKNQWLHLHYKNASGNEAEIKVMPLGIAQQGPRLYMVCRYDGYDNERLLAMHRIQKAELSTLVFKRPKDFDLSRFDEEGRFGFGEGGVIRLTFNIRKGEGAHLLETPLSNDQKVEELKDNYRITATVADTAMLGWWLSGFGDAVSDVRRRKIHGSGKTIG